MADNLEIMDALESLAVHCRPPLMSVDDRSRWMRDWCEDLKGFPGDAIRTGTSRWRQGESTKFPTPGQLIPMIKAVAGGTKPRPSKENELWCWPSEEELTGMTLSEKRRQYLIMASECRGNAGPMNSDGEHPRPEWLIRARNYSDEAQALTRHIASAARKREQGV